MSMKYLIPYKIYSSIVNFKYLPIIFKVNVKPLF
nr:MAG TPA: hypothetical protein [Caudoviricetes sp.]